MTFVNIDTHTSILRHYDASVGKLNPREINQIKNNLISSKHNGNFPAQQFLEEIKKISTQDYNTIIEKIINELLSTYDEYSKVKPRYQNNIESIKKPIFQTKASRNYIDPFHN